MELQDLPCTYLLLSLLVLGLSVCVVGLTGSVITILHCSLDTTCANGSTWLRMQLASYESLTRLDVWLILGAGVASFLVSAVAVLSALRFRMAGKVTTRPADKLWLNAPFWPGLIFALFTLAVFLFTTISLKAQWDYAVDTVSTVKYSTEGYICTKAPLTDGNVDYYGPYDRACGEMRASRYMLIPLFILLPSLAAQSHFHAIQVRAAKERHRRSTKRRETAEITMLREQLKKANISVRVAQSV